MGSAISRPSLSSASLSVPAWKIVLNGKDITASLSVARIVYSEGVGHQVARFDLTVQDIDRYWQNYSFARGKDTIEALLGYRGAALWSCGKFTVEGRRFRVGTPDEFTLLTSEGGFNNAVRTRNSFAYESKTLSEIADAIAAKHGLTAVTKAVDPDPRFARKTQRMETDLAFLSRLARENNYDFTIRNNQLIFYSRASLEEQLPTGPTITRSMLSYGDCELADEGLVDVVYGAATAVYFHPRQKVLVGARATDLTVSSLDTHKLVARYENSQQAALAASSNLWAANGQSTRGSLRMPGTLNWRAGNTVRMRGMGKFDDNTYLVHSLRVEFLPEAGMTAILGLQTVTAAAGFGQSITSDQTGGSS